MNHMTNLYQTKRATDKILKTSTDFLQIAGNSQVYLLSLHILLFPSQDVFTA